MTLRLVYRPQWGARTAVSHAPVMAVPTKKCYLHHTVAKVRGAAGMRQLEGDALDEGYTDIEYNWLTDPDGTNYEGRGGGRKSAAQNAPGGHDNNSECQCVCAMGNYETDQPPDSLVQGIGEMVAHMYAQGWIDEPKIDGPHRDAPDCSTACCGKFLIARIGDINAIAAGAKAPARKGGAMDMVRTPSGRGYYIVAADGGVFCYGDAKFFGSMGGKPLAAPVVDMAITPKGDGYILVASDGGVFAFGKAQFQGSMGGQRLNAPIVGCEFDAEGDGYWLLGQDGGVFTFGKTSFYGSASGKVKYP